MQIVADILGIGPVFQGVNDLLQIAVSKFLALCLANLSRDDIFTHLDKYLKRGEIRQLGLWGSARPTAELWIVNSYRNELIASGPAQMVLPSRGSPFNLIVVYLKGLSPATLGGQRGDRCNNTGSGNPSRYFSQFLLFFIYFSS